MRRGLLVYNPVAGGMRFEPRLGAIITRAHSAGIELEPHQTTAPGSATEIVARLLSTNPDLIVAAGGDGTVGEAAAALIGSDVPLAVLPCGTANVLAREYGIGASMRQAERTFVSHRTRPITAWRADEHTCFMWMGIGLDARVMKNAIPSLKRLFGRAGIGVTALTEALRYDYPAIAVEGIDANGAPFSREATYVIASNIRRYGGEPQLSPRADPEDELLDLTLFTGRSFLALAQFSAGVALGRATDGKLAHAEQFPIRSMSARALGPVPIDVQLDGAAVSTTPATIGPPLGRVQVVIPEYELK